MMTPLNSKYIILIACLVLAACVPAAVGTEPPQVDSTPTPSERALETATPDISERRPEPTIPGGLERVQPTPDAPMIGEVPPELLGEINTDLVKETGADRDAIKVVRAEAVVWNDGSLGCPKPGEFYIQMLVSGYWVVLEVAGQEYDYRANDSGYFFLCEGKGGPPMPPPDTGVDIENPLLVQAKEDLAGRLGISPNQIALLSFEAVVWPDSSMGCPQPGMAYAQVLMSGYWVVLEVEGQEYDYRANDSGYFTLCEGKGRPPFSPPGDERGKPPPEK